MLFGNRCFANLTMTIICLYMFAVLDFCICFAIMLQGFCYYMCVYFIWRCWMWYYFAMLWFPFEFKRSCTNTRRLMNTSCNWKSSKNNQNSDLRVHHAERRMFAIKLFILRVENALRTISAKLFVKWINLHSKKSNIITYGKQMRRVWQACTCKRSPKEACPNHTQIFESTIISTIKQTDLWKVVLCLSSRRVSIV